MPERNEPTKDLDGDVGATPPRPRSRLAQGVADAAAGPLLVIGLVVALAVAAAGLVTVISDDDDPVGDAAPSAGEEVDNDVPAPATTQDAARSILLANCVAAVPIDAVPNPAIPHSRGDSRNLFPGGGISDTYFFNLVTETGFVLTDSAAVTFYEGGGLDKKVIAQCGDGRSGFEVSGANPSPTSSTPMPAPSTTIPRPASPAPDAFDDPVALIQALFSAWERGDRRAASAYATEEVIADLFGYDGAGEGLTVESCDGGGGGVSCSVRTLNYAWIVDVVFKDGTDQLTVGSLALTSSPG